MNEVKDLLIVRLGCTHDPETFKDTAKFYKDEIKSHIIIVIIGENDDIETKFQIVHLK